MIENINTFLTTTQISYLTNTPIRTVRYFIKECNVIHAKGSGLGGSKRVFGNKQLIVLSAAIYLDKAGFRLRKIKDILEIK